MSGCGSNPSRQIELAPEVLGTSIQTLVLALLEVDRLEAVVIDRTVTRDEDVASLAPRILAWDDSPATYVALGYALPIADLGLRAGDARTDSGEKVPLPAASLTRVLDLVADTAWHDGAIPERLSLTQVPGTLDPIGCLRIRAHIERPADRQLDFHELAATGPDTAIVVGALDRGLGASAGFEIHERMPGSTTASVTVWPLVEQHGRFQSLVFDGEEGWATDAQRTLLRLDRHARLLGVGAPGEVVRVSRSPTGEVFGFGPSGVFAMTRGSTRTVAIATTDFPLTDTAFARYRQSRFAALSARRMIALDPDGIAYSLRDGTWRRIAHPAEDPNPLVDVAIEEGYELAITAARVHRRTDGAWEALPGAAVVANIGIVAYGEQRLVINGQAGSVDIRPKAGAPELRCADTPMAANRYMNRAAVDTTGTTLFVIDTYEDDADAPYLARVDLPP